MTQFPRHFTPAEANAELPWVRAIFARVHAIIDRLEGAAPPMPKKNGHGHGNGHANGGAKPSASPAPDDADLATLPPDALTDLANGLLRAVQDKGIVIQDARRVLIDFPALRGGEEVLLCYEAADGDRITHWHAVEAGYAGRRPLDADWQ